MAHVSGERRVQFAIALLTAIIAALGLAGIEIWKKGHDLQWFFIASTIFLTLTFVFSYATFERLVKRNCVTEEYKEIAKYRRRQLGLDEPLDFASDKCLEDFKPARGGLVDLVAIMNGVLLFVLGLLLSFLFYGWNSLDLMLLPKVAILPVVVSVTAVGYWICMADKKRKNYRKKFKIIMKKKRKSFGKEVSDDSGAELAP